MTQQQNAKPARPEEADPLTIAYLAIGANEALHKHRDVDLDAFNGQIGFIEKITMIAAPMDAVCEVLLRKFEGASGPWCYEVAEPVGNEFAALLLADEEANWVPVFEKAVAKWMQISNREVAEAMAWISLSSLS